MCRVVQLHLAPWQTSIWPDPCAAAHPPGQVKVVFPPPLADVAASGRSRPAAIHDWQEGDVEGAGPADAGPPCYMYVCRKGY